MEAQSEVKSIRINLGESNPSTRKHTSKKLSNVIGGLFLLSSLFMFFDYLEEGTELFRHNLYIGFYLITGVIFLFRAQALYSEKSKIAPHLLISEMGAEIKPGIFNSSQFINWNDIQKIELADHKIGFK